MCILLASACGHSVLFFCLSLYTIHVSSPLRRSKRCADEFGSLFHQGKIQPTAYKEKEGIKKGRKEGRKMCLPSILCKFGCCLVLLVVIMVIVLGKEWIHHAVHTCIAGHSLLGKCDGAGTGFAHQSANFGAPPPSTTFPTFSMRKISP